MSFFRVSERKTTFLLVLHNHSECTGGRATGENKTQAFNPEKPVFLYVYCKRVLGLKGSFAENKDVILNYRI